MTHDELSAIAWRRVEARAQELHPGVIKSRNAELVWYPDGVKTMVYVTFEDGCVITLTWN